MYSGALCDNLLGMVVFVNGESENLVYSEK